MIFNFKAKLYAKIIIDEKFLPVEKKTIKPANMGVRCPIK